VKTYSTAPAIVAGLTGAAVTLLVAFAQPAQAADWRSGVRNNDTTISFASWRGSRLGVVSGWIDWKKGWSGMYSYASGTQPRALRTKSANISFGHGLFPQGGNLAACANGGYDSAQREVARRLAANGAGDAEIRLGWEASGDWFPWSAAGKPAAQWKSCFTHVARAMKSAAPNLRIGWYMAKKGRIDVRTIYPDDAPITYIGISHYDDGEARFGSETYQGGPWGLREFLRFARSKGKKFAIGEWGVGRRGDNPDYIRSMHAFFREAGSDLAHEAYFNAKEHRLFPNGLNPRSAEAYRQLF
jgi:hypothetical protein